MENLDFLPDRIRQQRSRRNALIRQGYLVAACCVGIVLLAYMRQGTIRSAQAELSLLKDRSGNVQQQLAMRAGLEAQQAELMIKKRIDDQIGSRANALDILAELDQIVPPSMILGSLTLEATEQRQTIQSVNGGLAPSAAGRQAQQLVVNRMRMVITGIAPTDVDVANFIGQLSASPLFEDVNMGYARNCEFRGRGAREFQVSCYVIR